MEQSISVLTWQEYHARYHYNRVIPSDMLLTTSLPLTRILKRGRPPPTKFKGSFHNRSKYSEAEGGGVSPIVAAMAGTARFCDCHERVTTSPRESSTGLMRPSSANCVGARARVTPPHLRIGRAQPCHFFFFPSTESVAPRRCRGSLQRQSPKSEVVSVGVHTLWPIMGYDFPINASPRPAGLFRCSRCSVSLSYGFIRSTTFADKIARRFFPAATHGIITRLNARGFIVNFASVSARKMFASCHGNRCSTRRYNTPNAWNRAHTLQCDGYRVINSTHYVFI